ncbi:hypothetical protein C8J56DRAFT_1117038 [Mycena floridula]|nr:hypothetical protein C8J56DRAFT_1117038 [Mycena floridula]
MKLSHTTLSVGILLAKFVAGAHPGLSWSLGSSSALTTTFDTPTIAALYTWTAFCPSQMSSLPYQCYPMLAGGSASETAAFQQVASQHASDFYMGFNECNEAAECNLSPNAASQVWLEFLAPLRTAGKKLAMWHNAFPTLPIWITEFAYEDFSGATPTLSEVETFFEQAIAWINEQSYIEIYFPFGNMPPGTGSSAITTFLNANLTLNALGHIVYGF